MKKLIIAGAMALMLVPIYAMEEQESYSRKQSAYEIAKGILHKLDPSISPEVSPEDPIEKRILETQELLRQEIAKSKQLEKAASEGKEALSEQPASTNPYVQELLKLASMTKPEIQDALEHNTIFNTVRFRKLARPNFPEIVNTLAKHTRINKKLLKKVYRVYSQLKDLKVARRLWYILDTLLIKYELTHGEDGLTQKIYAQLHDDLRERFTEILLPLIKKESGQQGNKAPFYW